MARSHYRADDRVQQHGVRERVGGAVPAGDILGVRGGETAGSQVHESFNDEGEKKEIVWWVSV